MAFDLRVRLYTSPTQRGRILPAQTINFVPGLNSTSTLTFTLSERAAGYLPAGFVVAVEYRSRSGAWIEPRNGRFIVEEDSGDDASMSRIVAYTGIALIPWLLSKNELATAADAKDGARAFVNRSPGFIMNTYIAEAQARGWAPFVTAAFTSANASGGTAWPAESITASVEHPLRTKASRVLEGLVSAGLCDWWTEGNALHLGLYGTGNDLTTGDDAVLLGHRAATRKGRTNFSEVFTALTVIPELATSWVELSNPGAPTAFGRLEETLTLDGVDNAATATQLAQPHLVRGRASRREYTVTQAAAEASYVPFDDYSLGDLVRVETAQGIQSLRVVELTCQRSVEGNVTVTVAFEYRFRSLEARLAGRVGTGSAGRIVGGVTNRPLPSAQTVAIPEPKAPTGLAVSSNAGAFDDDGVPISVVALVWDPVAQATDDTTIDVELYELWISEDGGDRRRVTSTTQPSIVLTLTPDVEYTAEVRARSVSGLWSSFAGPLIFIADRDTTALASPTAPTLTTRLGTVRVDWDGLLTSGAPPARFRRAYAAISNVVDGTYAPVGPTFAAGGTVIAGLPVGEVIFVRLYAVDSNSIVSPPSAAASITVEGVGAGDIDPGAVTIADLDSEITDAIADAQAAATAAQQSADGKNTVHYSPSAPAGTAHALDDVWWDTDDGFRMYRWDGTQWSSSQLGTSAIANLAITNALIAALDAGKITTGFLAAARIDAGTLSVEKLLVASLDNMAEDPGFEKAETVWPNLTANVSKTTTSPRTGARALRVLSTAAAYEATRSTPAIPVEPGQEYRFAAFMRADTGTRPQGGLEIRVAYGATAGATTTLADVADSPDLGTAYTLVSGSWVVPAGVRYMRPVIRCADTTAGRVYLVDDFAIYKKSDSSLIVDGSITATKLAVGSVTATAIAADSVGANALQAQSVTAGKIAADAVTANEIAAGAVTADKIEAGQIETYHLAAAFGAELDLSSNEAVNILVGDIAAVNGRVDENGDTIEALTTYYRFGPDGATIESPGSVYALQLRNDGIAITESGVEVSRWDSGQLIVRSFIGEEVVLGNHKIERYTTGTVVRALGA